jgi:hypothetical protein
MAEWCEKHQCDESECYYDHFCEDCGHKAHPPGKCEVERGDGYRGKEYMEALGPCTCGMPSDQI